MYSSQQKSLHNVDNGNISAFGKRLRQAFNGAGNKEIADKLSLSKSALTNYMQGRIPPPETLLEIKRFTNCSLDWLLTGQQVFAEKADEEEANTPLLLELENFVRRIVREEMSEKSNVKELHSPDKIEIPFKHLSEESTERQRKRG